MRKNCSTSSRGRSEAFSLRSEFRRDVTFRLEDIRRAQPDGPIDLILCRNLAFTYFAAEQQTAVLGAIAARLAAGGYLAIGAHEQLPAGAEDPDTPGDVPPTSKTRSQADLRDRDLGLHQRGLDRGRLCRRASMRCSAASSAACAPWYSGVLILAMARRAAHSKSPTQITWRALRSMPNCGIDSGAWEDSFGKSRLNW